LSQAEVNHLERDGRVKVLLVREMENFFLFEPDAILAALQALKVPSLSVDTLDTQLRSLADDFVDVVVLRRVVSRLAPIYPAPWREIRLLAGSHASLIHLKSVIAASMSAARNVAAEATAAWADEEHDVRARWDEEWRSLVPAAELLDAMWQAHGHAFDKARDGFNIASSMTGPAALAQVIQDFSMAQVMPSHRSG
jgi:hypothetical protein